ncbi:MAG: SPFH domain-containing protein [Bacteroidales bacterium]|jgi:regulator of protease activity HflC (stomatin/prohibitin superfamily)|nr:SPFH domain-containing protein [Bacteroidales bacterium]
MESKEFNKTMTAGNNGFLHLFINLALLALSIWLIVCFAKFDCMLDAEGEPTAWILLPILTGSFLLFVYILDLAGFMIVQPNESRVLTFFGKYSGTVKQNGFFWANPFYSKEKLSLRAKNMDVEPIKVNDKNGNPIMIGLVLVWKINDTYKACFEVDSDVRSTITENSMKSVKSFDSFVRVQSDAALRKVAGMYAYDNMDRDDEEVTLRSGGEEINDRLEAELRKHLEIAGIEVVEARINYLAYAAEIASVMLRRQQADAIISAREKIVEGAVSMVDLALKKLSEDKIVELDEERKAAMVSNLLVVLCADESASPVINTGTLYQ